MKIKFLTFFIVFSTSLCGLAQEWFQLPSVPTPGRDDAMAFSIHEKGYLFSGLIDGLGYSNELYCFDPSTRTWSKSIDFPGIPRQYGQSIEVKDGVYIIGGYNSAVGGLKDCWFFDGETWTQKADLPGEGRWGTAGFSTKDGIILATGFATSGLTNEVWEYFTATNTWIKRDHLPGSPRRDAIALNLFGRKVIGSGIVYNPEKSLNDWYEWNQLYSRFEPLNDTFFAAIGYACGIGNGIVGGKFSSGELNENVYFIDPLLHLRMGGTYPEGKIKGVCGFQLRDTIYCLTGLNAKNERLNTCYGIYPYPTKQKEKLAIFYPNPGKGERVFLPKINGTLEIYDIKGVCIYKTQLERDIQLNISPYLNQLNVLRIWNENQEQMIKTVTY